jgi:hypothetical protein
MEVQILKINTITFHRPDNYGAVLQAYALQKYLLTQGQDVEIIDYTELKSYVFRPLNFKSIKSFLRDLYINLNILLKYKKCNNRHMKFSRFVDDYMNLTIKYNSLEELKNNPPKSDLYIAGSDQIWNMTYRISPEFFLDFGIDNVKRYSYAASLGTYEYPKDKLGIMENYLKRFKTISVREKSAQTFLKEQFNINSRIDVDPTFLIEKSNWLEIEQPYDIETPYILCYPLLSNENLQKTVDKLKKLTGYKVVIISSSAKSTVKGDEVLYDVGPREFLGLINNASYVVTSSFHGTVFSVLFEKTFYSTVSEFGASRIYDMLDNLDLSDRAIKSVDEVNKEFLDYSCVKKRISEYAKSSKKYLEGIIQGAQNEDFTS